MRHAFGWSVDRFIYQGGYPGAAPLAGEPARWARCPRDALSETTLARDVIGDGIAPADFLMHPVERWVR